MPLDPISSVNTTPATSPTQSAHPGMEGLDENAFLMLLLAQLKNQDPLKPMEDKDFIAQLAQFNSLNQLTELNKTMKELMTAQTVAQGSALIGKTVSGLSSDGGVVTGLVSGLRLTGDKVMLDVEGHNLPLERVNSVQSLSASE